MQTNTRLTKAFFKLGAIMLISVLSTSVALADRSPANCTGSGLNIVLNASASEVHIGDVITYAVTIFNGFSVSPVVCDATNITASLITPGGANHPIVLTRTTLLNSQSDYYPNVFTYTAQAKDVKPDGTLMATASDQGVIHQNDTNSQGGGNQGVNTTVIDAPKPPLVTPPIGPTISSETHSSSGSTVYGCKDIAATNYNFFSASNPALCIYANVVVPILPAAGFPPFEEHAPIRLKIPRMHIDAPIEPVGLTSGGAMDISAGPSDASWFDVGPRPGEIGSAVIAGHYGWKDGVPAAFDALHGVVKGDLIFIENGTGSTTIFVVREIRTYSQNDSASEVFFSHDGISHLNLVTCEGAWNKAEHRYADRRVVFADKAYVSNTLTAL